MNVTTMTVGGLRGPTWSVDDLEEGEALAVEHGYEVLDATEDINGDWILVVAG